MNFSMMSTGNNSESLWVNESLTNLSAISSNENGSSFPIGSGGNKKRVNYVFTAYLVIGVVGVIGNAVVVATILSSKAMKKKFTNILIVNQSFIDMVSSVLLMITAIFNNIEFTSQSSKPGLFYSSWFYCSILRSKVLLWAIYQSSTYNIMAIAIERYIEIRHPLYHKINMTKKKLYIVMVMAWLSGFIYQGLTGAPFLKAQYSGSTCWPLKIFPSLTLRLIVSYSNILIHFLIPIIVMAFCYIKIVLILRKKSSASIATTSQGKVLLAARKNVIKITALVCLCFFLCWVGNQVFYFLYLQNVPGINLESMIAHITIIMTAVNVCINPYIYALSYNEFQMALKKLFCKSRQVNPTNNLTVDSQTKSSKQTSSTNTNQNRTTITHC